MSLGPGFRTTTTIDENKEEKKNISFTYLHQVYGQKKEEKKKKKKRRMTY